MVYLTTSLLTQTVLRRMVG